MKAILLICAILSVTTGSRCMADTILGTPITRVPTVISKPGKYRLAGNLTMPQNLTAGQSHAAITVQTDDVVIDFNGYSLTASGSANITNSAAIEGTGSHYTICNGTIVGFGVAINGGEALTVEDMTCESQIGDAAIECTGRDGYALRCRITNPSRGTSTSIGILFVESGVVEDCTVSDLVGRNPTVGIVFVTEDAIEIPPQYLDYSDIVRHCVISNLSTANLESGTGVITASNNTVIDDSSFYNLMVPFKANTNASIIAKQSTFKSCGSSFISSGVTDGGGNCLVQ